MSQISFPDVEYGAKRNHIRRDIFLAETDTVIPCARLMALIESVYPKGWQWSDLPSNLMSVPHRLPSGRPDYL